jgi:hypothetical protein
VTANSATQYEWTVREAAEFEGVTEPVPSGTGIRDDGNLAARIEQSFGRPVRYVDAQEATECAADHWRVNQVATRRKR